MRVALLTSDSRGFFSDYRNLVPEFGTAPEALLQGCALLPDVEVHVVSCARGKMISPTKLAPNVFFHSLCVPKLGWMSTGYQGCIRAVRSKLKELQPDIVHGQGTERDCAMSAIFSGFPNVVTIHGNMAELARLFRAPIGSFGWLAARLENFALRRTAGVLCNSEYTERLVAPRARQVWRVPNAIREQFFAPPTGLGGAAKCALVNVGHPCSRKRQLELIEVIRDLRGQGLKFEFQFVGDYRPTSPYVAAFLEKIKPLEKDGFVRCDGSKTTNELIRTFDASAAMVHFPSEESFGLVVAEALARDLKFFGARLGGIPEITVGASDAELFAADDWRGLTSAIAAWIRRGFPRADGSAQSIRTRYHPGVIARRHVEIYQEVLGRAA
ncbi:MAG: glycosyltransferase family 4 protein [Verrucomicrobiota bacterium]